MRWTWLPGLSAYAPEPTVEEADLSELCAAAGWQKVCGWGNMMIYANDQPDPVPLITDERLRLQNLHAAMKKGSLPGMGAVFGVSAALALLLWPIWAVSCRTAPDVTVLLAVCALGLPGIWLLSYWGWYRTARRAVEENRPCPVNRARAGWIWPGWPPLCAWRQIPVSGMVQRPAAVLVQPVFPGRADRPGLPGR